MGNSNETLDRLYELVIEDKDLRKILETGSMSEKMDALRNRSFSDDDIEEISNSVGGMFPTTKSYWWVY
jgi:hypothetical protein